jgi:hypothetical protein
MLLKIGMIGGGLGWWEMKLGSDGKLEEGWFSEDGSGHEEGTA